VSGHGTSGWLRRAADLPRPTFLELFFDLAFVFSLTQLSELLIHDLSWAGAYRTLVLLMALWWTWTTGTWTTDLYEPSHPGLQALVVVVMFGVVVMATSISGAFAGQSVTFASAFVGANLSRGLVLSRVARDLAVRRRPQRVAVWAVLTAPLWLIGAVLHGTPQRVLWTVAAGADYVLALLGWPVPGLGRSPDSEWHLGAEHLAERYRQMFIIGLGDTILVMGLTYVQTPSTPARAAALTVVFLTTVLLWQIYFRYAGQILAETMRRRARVAALFVVEYHLLMVAGIVVTAVGYDAVLRHPLGHIRISWIVVIVGGPALFLVGRILFGRLVLGHLSWARVIALAGLGVVAAVAVLLPPLAVSALTAAVLGSILVPLVSPRFGRLIHEPAVDSQPQPARQGV
jgi:low temperature requirement protein LtrA